MQNVFAANLRVTLVNSDKPSRTSELSSIHTMRLPFHIDAVKNLYFTSDQRKWAVVCFFPVFIGLLFPVLVPFLHIGVISHLWDEYKREVDRKHCTCSCFDTVFKGAYERGISGYKHVYFNATSNTFKIWASTVFYFIALYESVKYLARLFVQGKLRFTMLALFLSILYAHYYSWWSYFNYWNDDFYSQWNHQLFFSLTEFCSTLCVLHLANKDNAVTGAKIIFIMAIAIVHVLASGWDQFITNVVKGEGSLHQVLRDVFFMGPDLLHIALPIYELQKAATSKRLAATHLISDQEFFCALGLVVTLGIVSLCL